MKFASLILSSSIVFSHQHTHTVAASSSGGTGVLRNIKKNVASAANNKDIDVNRKLQVMIAYSDCLSYDELDFPNNASNSYCVGNDLFSLARTIAESNGCRNNQAKRAVIALTGASNKRGAKQALAATCLEYVGSDPGPSPGPTPAPNPIGGPPSNSACTTLEELSFRTIGECSTRNVKNRVEEKMAANGCTHNYNTEISLLFDTDDTDIAKIEITDRCKREFGCVTNFDLNGCDYNDIMDAVNRKLRNCPHGIEEELQAMTNTGAIDDAKVFLKGICDEIFENVDTSSYTDIDSRFTNSFMNEYVAGRTFLNEETGNFQGRQNRNPATPQSLSAGESIDNFYDDNADSTILTNNGFGNFDSCKNQAYMCCFGRDRQSNDNNGNCANNNCEDADPGDNSNLCFTEPSNTPYAGKSENDIHCHGLAWAEDENDLISLFKMNNFFYVSMYDHMYTRGYVEPAIRDSQDDIPMCACIEDMPKVSRSDCTQVDVDLPVSFTRNSNGDLVATSGNIQVDFNACRGIDFDGGNRANNDLASYAVKLVEKEQMSMETRDRIFETLLGYADPNKNENEQVCQDAYDNLR